MPSRQAAGAEATGGEPRVRVDRWLAAARVFKTRSQATHACDLGRVRVNGTAAKPHRPVAPGDTLEVEREAGLRRLVVLALADRPQPRERALELFRDESPPPPVRDPLDRWRARPPIHRVPGAGRPTKQERRRLAEALRGEGADSRDP